MWKCSRRLGLATWLEQLTTTYQLKRLTNHGLRTAASKPDMGSSHILHLVSISWYKNTPNLAPDINLLAWAQVWPPGSTTKKTKMSAAIDFSATALLFLQWSIPFAERIFSFILQSTLFSLSTSFVLLLLFLVSVLNGNLSHPPTVLNN